MKLHRLVPFRIFDFGSFDVAQDRFWIDVHGVPTLKYARGHARLSRRIAMTVFVLFCWALLMPFGAAAQARHGGRLLIVEANPQHMPDIAVRLGLFDAHGQPVSDLQDKEITVAIGGQPLTTTLRLAPPAPRALTVLVVADFSAAMSDQSAPGQTRVSAMVEQIKHMLNLLAPDSPVSLIAFAEQTQLAFEWRADAAALRATLDALAARPLPAPAANTPYALNEAIKQGLAQFADSNKLIEGRPRALLVYAAGMPGYTIDTATMQGMLDGMGSNQPGVTFVGMGSSAAGQFQSQAGNPESLAQAAQTLRNTDAAFHAYYAAGTGDLTLLDNHLYSRYNALLRAEQLYTLTFPAAELPAGKHLVSISARGVTATIPVQVPALPPQIELRVAAPLLQSRAQTGIDVVYAQRPIERVEYFLDGHSIGAASAASNFALDADLTPLYAPGGALDGKLDPKRQYELVAVATDVDGQQSQPSSVGVWLQPPAADTATWLRRNLSAVAFTGLGVLIVMSGIVFVVLTQSRKRRQAIGSSVVVQAHPFDDKTRTVPAPRDMQEQTLLVPSLPRAALRVTVIEGRQRRTYPLTGGPEWTIGRKPGHAIHLDNKQISHDHARLKLGNSGVELTDLKSSNGTFVGDERRRLAPGTPEFLRFGESFWVGFETRLLIEQ